MLWLEVSRFLPRGAALADQHYNRQTVGSPQFSPPGKLLVLLTDCGGAVWTSVWQGYAQHQWRGAWANSIFRNETAILSSLLIREAVAATRAAWGEPPPLGMVTFVDAQKTRRKRDPGRCYRKAGFRHVGFTAGGLYVLQMLPAAMPEPQLPIGGQTAFGFGSSN